MDKMKLINHARNTETGLNEYLQIIYDARQDTIRTISNLKAVINIIDFLTAPRAGESGFAEDTQEALVMMTEHANTLALMALATARNTIIMIQKTIPQAQEVAAKAAGLVHRLTREQTAPEAGYDSCFFALAEIRNLVRQVEQDALTCVMAVKALLPQVENLQQQIIALYPRPGQKDGGQAKSNLVPGKSGAHLRVVHRMH